MEYVIRAKSGMRLNSTKIGEEGKEMSYSSREDAKFALDQLTEIFPFEDFEIVPIGTDAENENMIKLQNFRGAFATTSIEPTEKELLWLFNHLHEIDWNKCFSSSVSGICEHCINKDEDEQSVFSIYRVDVSEITDVDPERWDQGDCRELDIIVCESCKCWTAGDR